jgi:Immunity protein 41
VEYLNKNIGGDLWEHSFIGRLHEEGVWDKDEFWHLHADLTKYSIDNKDNDSLPRRVASEVARIIFFIMKSYAAHRDPNDGYRIQGVADEELYEFIERVELLSAAFFAGKILGESSFDLRNPYLTDA